MTSLEKLTPGSNGAGVSIATEPKPTFDTPTQQNASAQACIYLDSFWPNKCTLITYIRRAEERGMQSPISDPATTLETASYLSKGINVAPGSYTCLGQARCRSAKALTPQE